MTDELIITVVRLRGGDGGDANVCDNRHQYRFYEGLATIVSHLL